MEEHVPNVGNRAIDAFITSALMNHGIQRYQVTEFEYDVLYTYLQKDHDSLDDLSYDQVRHTVRYYIVELHNFSFRKQCQFLLQDTREFLGRLFT